MATFAEAYAIVQHPAFRLGFLDAQAGRPLDHDKIADRIFAETNERALERIGWGGLVLTAHEIEIAQYRYEEGRLAVVARGIRCKAWGHPDYPPKAVVDMCMEIAKERTEIAAARASAPSGASFISTWRETPLFQAAADRRGREA